MTLSATRWFGSPGRFTFSGDSGGIVMRGVLPVVVPCLVFDGWGNVEGGTVTAFVRSVQDPADIVCMHVLSAFELNGRLGGIPPGDYRVRLRYGDQRSGPSPYVDVDSGTVTVR